MTALAHLASFHAVCQTLNISMAAKTLGITQPSLSRQLKRLEESLGVTLFVRRQRGIALTDEGAKLAESLAPVLTTLTERLDLLRSQGRSTQGRLRIGSLTEIGKTMILPRLLAFAREYPDVEIDFRLLKGMEIVAALGAHELDFGVVTEMPTLDSLRVTRLAEERSLVVTRAINTRSLATTGDVVAARFVAYRQDDPLLGAFLKEHYPGIQRNRIRPQLAVNDHKCMIETLVNFDYYAVMPLPSVAGYLESATLRNASVHELRSTVWLARPEKRRGSLVTRAFEDFVLRHADGK